MNRYTYTDGNAGEQTTDWSPRQECLVPRVAFGLAIGRQTFGMPFPVKTGKLLFTCEAEDILAADAAFKAATGLDVVKQMGVQCRVAHWGCSIAQKGKPPETG